jgi:hypothetical protein
MHLIVSPKVRTEFQMGVLPLFLQNTFVHVPCRRGERKGFSSYAAVEEKMLQRPLRYTNTLLSNALACGGINTPVFPSFSTPYMDGLFSENHRKNNT